MSLGTHSPQDGLDGRTTAGILWVIQGMARSWGSLCVAEGCLAGGLCAGHCAVGGAASGCWVYCQDWGDAKETRWFFEGRLVVTLLLCQCVTKAMGAKTF